MAGIYAGTFCFAEDITSKNRP